MNRSKKIKALLCLLAVLCGVTFAVTRYEEEKEIIKNSDEIILQVEPEQVQSFAWEYGEESLAFHRSEDGTWLWEEDDAFPVDAEILADLLELFQEFGAAFAIEDVSDYSQYGLTEPECTIRFSTADAEYTVTLGAFSKMDSQRYVSIGDGNAYLVGTDPLESFQVTIRDMIDNDEVTQFDQASKITFEGLAGYAIHYEEESTKSYCADDVYFTGSLPLDTGTVDAYLDTLQGLSLSNYVTYKTTEAELASWGLDAPELTVTVDYSIEEEDQEETGTLTLYVSRDPAAVAEAEAAESNEETEEVEETEIPGYLRIGESPIVYEISEDLYESLVKVSYNDLRHTELLPADFADITQVDITLDGERHTLTTTAEEDAAEKDDEEETSWYYAGEEIDMTSFQSAVFNLFADTFTEEKPTGEEEISVTFHLNNENFPTVTVTLYRYDGSDCLATVDGDPVALIDRVYAVDLIEAVYAIVLN